MSRSIFASENGIRAVQEAFKRRGGSQATLAESVGCSRQTIIKFLAGTPVDTRFFQAICRELGLEWGEVGELDIDSQFSKQTADLDALVREVRTKVAASIQKRCGTMRVLDMEQPITIDSIYTSVNILEKISRNQRRSIEELLEGSDGVNFDRFILGEVNQQRIPGLDAVKNHDKLLILGKPGAGKTTFLKWLALQCQAGKLYADRVPFFVTLKEFAEREDKPSLIDFLAQQLAECGLENAKSMVEKILRGGRAIILLDGLDEVRSNAHDRIINIIRSSSDNLDANRFVMTCRIAAKEYTFEKFTEVEVADFDTEQIADFAYKWFQPKDPIKAVEFPTDLETYPGLQELATNPLLLTLLCLVYEERAGFPVNRSELYKEGLDVLLKKWDAKRNIKRDEVYKQLSLQRKEDLLSQIAGVTFERSDYFFKQKFVEEQIQEYIRNLPNASNDPEALQLDSEAVLNSIAAQHGLLVERVRGIYSFSHLTFHEYFTARQFKEQSSSDFSNLLRYIREPRWLEVFLLTAGLLSSADIFLQKMKQQADALLSEDNKLQEFLVWLEKKSKLINTEKSELKNKEHYQAAAVRGFYFYHDRNIDNGTSSYLFYDRGIDLLVDKAFCQDLAPDLNKYHQEDLKRDRVKSNAKQGRIRDRIRNLWIIKTEFKKNTVVWDIGLDQALTRALNLVLTYTAIGDSEEDLLKELAEDLQISIDFTSDNSKLSELKEQLQVLKSKLPDKWKDENHEWIDKLRITIKHRDIGHDWNLSPTQEALLKDYYYANYLLVKCLNQSDTYVNKKVREEIESTLLLPIESIEKYKAK